MEINWQRDVDAALRQANETGKPVLLDFTAAPM
jgi:thiol:disulfide interchange protein